jgi:hypothetical protein
MHVNEYLKYRHPEEFPVDRHPISTDYFLTLLRSTKDDPPPKSVKEIVGLFPRREPRLKLTTLPFYVFTTSRTIYSGLRQLENVFTEFYMSTGVLPNIKLIQSYYLTHPKDLPWEVIGEFGKRGGLIYGTQE